MPECKINKLSGILLLGFLVISVGISQGSTDKEWKLFKKIPAPSEENFLRALDPNALVVPAGEDLTLEEVLKKTAAYFKRKAAERFYFNWRNVPQRLQAYYKHFPEMKEKNLRLAREHMTLYPAASSWKLPMNALNGQPISAYQFRHLARQSKVPDLALSFYLQNRDTSYINYFIHQVQSLNMAFENARVETGGNAVYEIFRAGKRMHHWLFCHHLFLADSIYDWSNQILLLRTFLHHGRLLYAQTQKFRPGNHQTRGLVALFEIAALFPEFKSAEGWRKHAVNGLLWHMDKEINDDGFQFERSGHYHKGDIENYLRVYRLAQMNGIGLPDVFVQKFTSMFEALVQLAMPNGAMPVLQDDTDGGSEIEADLSEPMAVGAMLFSNPVFRYFAGDEWPAAYYWLLTASQLDSFAALDKQKPSLGSVALPQTGYYVMRDGWNREDNYMIVSAGLEKRKPDHQHGDILGLIAYSGGTVFLPNYKVRYNRSDFSFLKNSWAKNVALVDSLTLGQKWQGNRGGSGFGKWKKLAQPKVLCWHPGKQVDFFSARHNGFDADGVSYRREIFFIKGEFWLLRDVFESNGRHTYQQVWQGPFKKISTTELQQELAKGQKAQIIQLNENDYRILQHSFNGKQNSVFQIKEQGGYNFTTFIAPYEIKSSERNAWIARNYTIKKTDGYTSVGKMRIKSDYIVFKENKPYLFIAVRILHANNHEFVFAKPAHILVLSKKKNKIEVRFFGEKPESQQDSFFKNENKWQCGSIVRFKI